MEDDEEHSPASLASKLEAELTTISYHVRVLHSCRVILAVREDQVRGVTQHVYRRTLNTPWALDLLAEEGANPMT